MKILHTSDWHLGRSLYGRRRYEEFSAFLDWLANTITQEKIDILLVAGDIFDTTTPSNTAQELYYQFLCTVSASCCHNIVVIAGNHDSPSFLNAPKELLKVLNVYVVGSMTDNPEDEVIVLKHKNTVQAIICAVPYLRDRDLRSVEAGESVEDKNNKLLGALKQHYADVVDAAERIQNQLADDKTEVPIIAMGHLFTKGGQTIDGDGVRELYVGSLAHIGTEVFPCTLSYVALGHLHVPQMVNNCPHIRYSGSPIAMGYGEAGQDKKVIIVNFSDKTPNIQEVSIPCFQELQRLIGDTLEITTAIEELKENHSNAWLEVEYTGIETSGNIRQIIEDLIADSKLEIRRIKNRRITEKAIHQVCEETLDDLDVNDVFERCLDIHEIKKEDREELLHSYQETIKILHEEDSQEF